MIAQAGLDHLVGPLLLPYVSLWLVATALLLSLVAFGVFVACLRCWNTRRDQRQDLMQSGGRDKR